ncbi:gamma carbonic anhydrase family protein [Mycoplana dimorpha]|uniref:Carbonic anhydrase/acetyltransferase-like protein (Isoleucine patch superfamily) n=1 Tax=Mycoplana dimorpha TaxID=28320 RepID=A0A2T5B8B0_MYCDI|nr:gamma carbonic anhydrase family protein [Mycoplana dimorpha]PTM95222.1 carbonic anhydrase/acetyltransferase-like protein (isoleucine patch superfamily) [Mycoplana dimorpha]
MPLYALGNHVPTLPADERYWVAPDAQVIGKVVIGEDVGIWFGATLRGDNEPITLGARTNIQENTVIHTDPGKPVTISEGCTIGHGAIIHGCTIGDNSLIGMGATVLNGAVIGNNCLVGAGALVTEGKVFPDNSLIVGSPARVVRMLDETAIEGLKTSAESYVRNWKRFKAELRRLD